jgi:chloramphenicol-sensitive protein RarD
VLFALGAYLWWGILAVYYFDKLKHVDPSEVIAHRILWTVVLLLVLLWITGGLMDYVRVFRRPRDTLFLGVAALLVSANWWLFVYAIQIGELMQCALGYFMTPLVQISLGVIFLRERMSIVQGLCVLLATAALVMYGMPHGEQAFKFPWISLGLAGSFGVYSLIRKKVPVGALPALAVETTIILPIGLAILGVAVARGTSAMQIHSTGTLWLLLAAGAMTAIPLLLFGAGARRLKLRTIGFMQYIGPSCQFLMAVLVYGQKVDQWRLVCFAVIWVALILYSIETILASRRPASPLSAAQK